MEARPATYTRPPKGMAASDPHTLSDRLSAEALAPLPAAAIMGHLGEEIDRSGRHGTPLSCLLVVFGEPEPAGGLPQQTLAYVGGVLRRELRRFDRVGRPGERELLIVLPGADSPRAEMVARRALERMQAIKIEEHGARRSLRVAVGIASWRGEDSAETMLERARAATRAGRSENGADGLAPAPAGRTQADSPAEGERGR